MFRIYEQTKAQMQQGHFSDPFLIVDDKGVLTIDNKNKLQNLALNKPYTKTANATLSVADTGNKMFTDGVKTSFFRYNSTSSEELTIDLGSPLMIGGTNYVGDSAIASNPYYVETLISTDGINFVSLGEIGDGTGWQSQYLNNTFEGTLARYVKFRTKRTTPYVLSVYEGEVYFGGIYKGYREVIHDISNVGTYRGSYATWSQVLPVGTNAWVQTSISFDGGSTWSSWYDLEILGSIGGVPLGTDLSNARLKVRTNIETNNINSPKFSNFNLYFDDDHQLDSGYIIIPNNKHTDNTIHPIMTSNTTPAPYVLSSNATTNEATLPIYNAFDGDITNTKSWTMDSKTSGWLKIDLGEDNNKPISGYQFFRSGLYYPIEIFLEASTDDVNWVTLDRTYNLPSLTEFTKRIDLENIKVPYRYYRLYFNKFSNIYNVSFNEIRFLLASDGYGHQIEGSIYVRSNNDILSSLTVKSDNIVISPIGYTNVDATPVMTSSKMGKYEVTSNFGTYPSWEAFRAFDGSSNNYQVMWYESLSNSIFTVPELQPWVCFNFGDGNGKVINRYSISNLISSNVSYNNGMPMSWKLHASNNGYDWILFDERTNEPAWVAGEKRFYDITNNKRYTKYRLTVTGSRSSSTMNIAEIEYYENTPQMASQLKSSILVPYRNDISGNINVKGTSLIIISDNFTDIPAMTSNTTPPPYAISSSSAYNATYPAWKAFDKSLNESWLSASGKTSGEWIQIDYGLGNEKYINAYRISTRGNSNGALPKSFRFLASNDEINWIELDRRKDEINWTVGETRTYDIFGNPAEKFRYYRLEVLEINPGSYVAIGELELLGVQEVRGSQLDSNLRVKDRFDLPSNLFVKYYNRAQGRVNITPVAYSSIPSSVIVKVTSDLTSTIKIPFYNRAQGVVDVTPPPRTTVGFNPIQDAFVREGTPTFNYGVEQSMLVGYSTVFNELYRSLVQFDISTLPQGQRITKAKLKLYNSIGKTSDYRVGAFKNKLDWNETSVTWKNHEETFDLVATSSIGQNVGYVEFDLMSIVNEWYLDPSTNKGLLLKFINEHEHENLQFYSREASSNVRPVLEIEYYNPVNSSFGQSNMPSSTFVLYRSDLKSSLRIPFYNIDNSLPSNIKIKDKDSIWGSLFINQRELFASVTVTQTDEDDLQSNITVRITDVDEIDGSIFISVPDLISKVYVLNREDLASSIIVVQMDSSVIQGSISVSKPDMPSSVYVLYRHDLYSSFVVRGYREDDLRSSLTVTNDTLHCSVSVVFSSSVDSSINVRVNDRIQIPSKIIVPHHNDLQSKVFVVGASMIGGSINILSGYLRSRLTIPYGAFKELDSRLNVRVWWASDMPTTLIIRMPIDDEGYAFIM